MKKLLFFLFIIFIIGCIYKHKEVTDFKGRNYDQIVQDELATGIRHDTIFLDFIFGMTKHEANRHYKKLLKNKKIYLDDEYKYTYDFIFGEYDYKKLYGNFSMEFHKKKLYELTLVLKSHDILYSTKSFAIISIFNIKKLFRKKYNYPDLLYLAKKNDDLNFNYFIWVDGNREIKIRQTIKNNIIINYTDLSIKIKLVEEEKEKTKSEIKKTVSDI